MGKRVLAWVGAVGGAVVAAAIALPRWLEPKLVYQPVGASNFLTRPNYAAVEAGRTMSRIEDVWLTTADGVRIHAWLLGPRKGKVDELPVFLWFHGNAGNNAGWLPRYETMVDLPARVLAVDYRGYGKSEGTPSEDGLYRDADAAWEYLTRERGIPPGRIFIYGFSLGGAVAIDLASRVRAAGLVIESSFTTLPEVAAAHYPVIPKSIIRTKMDSLSKIGKIAGPKLFFHSPSDEVVPYGLGRRLFEAASGPKEFLEVEGAGHNETFEAAGERLFDAVRRLVRNAGGQPSPRP